MIRKLRWKVVALTMLFVAALLLSVFAGAYFSARSSLRRTRLSVCYHHLRWLRLMIMPLAR